MAALDAGPGVVASDCLHHAWRATDPPVNRLCALIGGTDPLAIELGWGDRWAVHLGRWTGQPVLQDTVVGDGIHLVRIDPDRPPSMGSNGFLVRADALRRTDYTPSFVHSDVAGDLAADGGVFARLDMGIVHHYAPTLRRYAQKQRRRARRSLSGVPVQRRGYRPPPWRRVLQVRFSASSWGRRCWPCAYRRRRLGVGALSGASLITVAAYVGERAARTDRRVNRRLRAALRARRVSVDRAATCATARRAAPGEAKWAARRVGRVRGPRRRGVRAAAACGIEVTPLVGYIDRLRTRSCPGLFLHHPVLLETMEVRGSRLRHRELRWLRGHLSDEALHAALEEDAAGEPTLSVVNPDTSQTALHHLFHLERLRHRMGVRAGDLGTIVEWGGGFGGFARTLRRTASAAPPAHVIIDLPLVAALQWTYLCTVFGEEHVDLALQPGHRPRPGAFTLVPAAIGLDLDVRADLFVSLWGLSEVAAATGRRRRPPLLRRPPPAAGLPGSGLTPRRRKRRRAGPPRRP